METTFSEEVAMTQHITPDLARELWDQTPHNWNDFCQVLRSDPGRVSNLDEAFRERLCRLAGEMQEQGNGFPNSPDNLFELLANRLGLYVSSG
jgi:hypothetical protein